MRVLIAICGAGSPARAGGSAQAIVTSPAPERVAVTVYRDPDRGCEPLEPAVARRLCAGQRDPARHAFPPARASFASKACRGHRARRARSSPGLAKRCSRRTATPRLLSPGSLLDASLGERLHARRTRGRPARCASRKRSSARRRTAGRDPDGRRASRRCAAPACDETLLARGCPPGCRPSRRCRSRAQPRAGRARR